MNLMFRKRTILILVFAMMTTFLAPARFAIACQMKPQSTACPMMATMRKMAARQKAEGSSCCAKKAAAPEASISAPCCCKMQPAPTVPSLPEVIIAAESPVFVLFTSAAAVALPVLTTLSLVSATLETTAPRGPPLPFTALRAPPVFS